MTTASDDKSAALLEHPHLFPLICRLLNFEVILELRALSTLMLEATDKAMVDEVAEYLLCGNEYMLPRYVWSYTNAIGHWHYWEREEFRERVWPFLIFDCDPTEAGCSEWEAKLILDLQQMVNSGDRMPSHLMTLPSTRRRAHIWTNLGNAYPPSSKFRHTVCGKQYSTLDCYVKAVQVDDTLDRAWHNVAWAMPADMKEITIGGRVLKDAEAGAMALKCNPKFGRGWETLAFRLAGADTIEVHGQQVTNSYCFARALELGESAYTNWLNLGSTLRSDEKVELDNYPGMVWDKRGCFEQSATLKPDYQRAWCALGGVLGAQDKVTIDEKEYNGRQCLVRAVALDPKFSLAWYRLGLNMSGEPFPVVLEDGTAYSRVQCLVAAVVLDGSKQRYRDALRRVPGRPTAEQPVELWGKTYRLEADSDQLVVCTEPTAVVEEPGEQVE